MAGRGPGARAPRAGGGGGDSGAVTNIAMGVEIDNAINEFEAIDCRTPKAASGQGPGHGCRWVACSAVRTAGFHASHAMRRMMEN
jgi:hypothetical protein